MDYDAIFKEMYFRVVHLGADLVWVDLDFCLPPSWPPAQPLLPNFHQLRQNWADSVTLKIKVNPTEVRDQEGPCTYIVRKKVFSWVARTRRGCGSDNQEKAFLPDAVVDDK